MSYEIADHILNNVCGGKKDTYEYLVSWIRNAILNPDCRSGTCVVLRGPVGCGKSFFVNHIVAGLFPQGTVVVETADRLSSGFGLARLKDCRLLFVDEVYTKRMTKLLQRLFSEDGFVYEQKGQEPERVDNRVNVIMAVGPDWVPSGFMAERMFVIDIPTAVGVDFAALAGLCADVKLGGLG